MKRLLVVAFSAFLAACSFNPTQGQSEMLEGLAAQTVTVALAETGDVHCSGVIVADGKVLTAAHCLIGEDTVYEIGFRGGEKRIATLAGAADGIDAAILDVSTAGYAAAKIASVKPALGDGLWAIGNSWGAFTWTVSRGVVSFVERWTEGDYADGRNLNPWLQTDTTVVPGNSGGPVFNDAGELVGTVIWGRVAGYGVPTGVNFVLPIDYALAAVAAYL